MVPWPIVTIARTVHSSAARARATRGGATLSEATASSPAQENSSSSGGKSAAVRFIGSSRSRDTTLTTNSPLARTLVSVSFTPLDVKCTIGGSAEITLKKLCGARLRTPRGERVDTQAIGRGTTRAVRRK